MLKAPQLKSWILRLYKSDWFFPVICIVTVAILTALSISGSSIGIYNTIFNGDRPDSHLLFGHPQVTRSDEYSVSSLMTIAQEKIGYPSVNSNVGNGEDVSVLGNLPYKDWSSAFRPENFGFFVLPFDNAFALKWWLPGLFLVLSSYFFVLLILPKRRLLAALLSSAFVLSPFFQWWYLPETLGTVAATLFGLIALIKILQARKITSILAWSAALMYVVTCFILLFYPPFQISCGLVALAFLIGYFIKYPDLIKTKASRFNRNIFFAVGAIILSIAIVVVFMLQHLSTIHAISNTVYPGTRVTKSGAESFYYFFSSNTSPVLEMGDRYLAYNTNTSKSELSNFIIVTPFLLLPALYMLYKGRRGKDHYPVLIAVTIVLGLFLIWLFIPGLGLLGKLTLLDKVPANRALIGAGLADFILLTLLVDLFRRSKNLFSGTQVVIYSLLVIIFYLLLDMHWLVKTPGFLGIKTAVLLALPIPIVVFLFLKRWYTWAIGALLGFTILSTFMVNPLYMGTDAAGTTTITQTIQKLNNEDPKRWAADENYLENFALVAGAQSLSATYYYPQLSLWHEIDPSGSQNDAYNRYAHVNLAFDRDPRKKITPSFYKRGEDLFYVITEACDPFLKNNNVGYLITAKPFNKGEADCATLKTTVVYPIKTYYIYKLSF